MKKKKENLTDAEKLRQRAEGILKTKRPKVDLNTSEAYLRKLIQELEIHQIELEIQNEELVLAVEMAEKAEHELEESEQKYRLLSENISDGIILVEHDKIKYISPGYAKLYGFSSEDIKQLNLDNIFSYIHPDDRERIRNEIAYVHSKQIENYRYEYSSRIKNGTYIWLEDALNCEYDETGKRIRTIVRSRDITARKKAEQALQENENRLKSVENIAHVGSYEIDLNTGNAIWSDETFHIFELNPETDKEPTAESYAKFVHEDDVDRLHELLKKSTETGSLFDLIYGIKTASNKIKYVHSVGEVHRDKNGKPSKMLGTFQDITDRQIAERTLKENEQRLQSLVNIFQREFRNKKELLDFALEEVLRLTKSKLGFISFYDEEKEQFSRYTWSKDFSKEYEIPDSKNIYDLASTGLCNEVIRQRKPIMVNDFQAPNPYRNSYPKGYPKLDRFLSIPVIIDNKIVALIGAANKETGYTKNDTIHMTLLMNTVWQIIQKLEREELIKDQNEQLLATNKQKDTFLQILAHDLRTPFNSLLGFSDLLLKNIHKYDINKIEKQVGFINDASGKAFNLLNDLLLWAKAQSNKVDFTLKVHNVKDVFDAEINSLEPLAHQKQIVINSLVPENVTGVFDADMIKTVFRNLMSNAIKFTPKNGVIKVTAKKQDKQILVQVSDSGIGISEENLSNMWKIAELKTTPGTAGEKGTGFGLLLCKEFIEKHGGSIWVESEKGKGSVFSFSIPDLSEM